MTEILQVPQLAEAPDLTVFRTGPLAGLAIRTTLNGQESSEAEFYAAYSAAAGRTTHDKPAATMIIDPTDPHQAVLAEVSKAVEHSVFLKLDENTRQTLDSHYDSRLPRTHFVTLFDYQEDSQLPFPAATMRMDNTVLAPTPEELAITHPDVPAGYVSIEDITFWGHEVDEVLAATGLPDLRYNPNVTDIITIGRSPLYTPKTGMTKSEPLPLKIDAAKALYHETMQLVGGFMVTILNKPAHRAIQGFGRPWLEYEPALPGIKYDGENSKFTSKPYYSIKFEYANRLGPTEQDGKAMLKLLFDPHGGPPNIHFGSKDLLEI